MSTAHPRHTIGAAVVAPLRKIVERNQVWSRMAAKYGVGNPVPPWKTSLDGLCDALDHSDRGAQVLGFAERRGEEDALSATVYADLPSPENRLMALAHSLVVRGVIDESELADRLAAVRARLQG